MRPFLVRHEDHGPARWWWIAAHSPEQILATYREVTVFEEPPSWWDDDFDRTVPRSFISDEPDDALGRLRRA